MFRKLGEITIMLYLIGRATTSPLRNSTTTRASSAFTTFASAITTTTATTAATTTTATTFARRLKRRHVSTAVTLTSSVAFSFATSSLFNHPMVASTTTADCASSNNGTNNHNNDGDGLKLDTFDLSKLGIAAGVGAVPGFCAGFMLRKLGNVAIFFVGSTFCMFQLAAYKGYVTIHWEELEKDVRMLLKSKEVGDVMNPERAEQRVNDVVRILTPSTKNGAMGGFGVGFLAGIKLG